MNAFAVIPCTWSASCVVMTVTPVANIPSVRRNAAAGSWPGSPAISSSSASGVSPGNVSPIPMGANPPCTGRSNSSGGACPPGRSPTPSSRGYGEWLTGWSRPSANRENRNGSSSDCGSPRSSFATSAPIPIIL